VTNALPKAPQFRQVESTAATNSRERLLKSFNDAASTKIGAEPSEHSHLPRAARVEMGAKRPGRRRAMKAQIFGANFDFQTARPDHDHGYNASNAFCRRGVGNGRLGAAAQKGAGRLQSPLWTRLRRANLSPYAARSVSDH